MLHPVKCANQQNQVFVVAQMTYIYIFTGGTEEAYYACIISEEENHELKKALKVSATVFFIKDFISSCLDISPWDCWYVILLMGIICQKTSRMSAISFLFVRSLKEKCSII